MSEHRKKITIRVSSQTAYHLEAEAERLGISPGRVVDELMRGGQILWRSVWNLWKTPQKANK